jgi:hypothetical protein
MKFLIIGDSYGRGEYQSLNPYIPTQCTFVPDTGLDYYLRQFGHSVTNWAVDADCNFGQLRHAYWTLKENSDFDYIVWFHTDPIRDVVEHVLHDPIDGPIQFPEFLQIDNFELAMQYINRQNYIYAQNMIYQEFQIPFIVIAGIGRLDDSIDQFEFAHYKIYCWAQEILNLDYPVSRHILKWWASNTVFENFDYDKQQLLVMFEEADQYQKLLDESDLFPDNFHVCRDEYKKLAHRLLELLST